MMNCSVRSAMARLPQSGLVNLTRRLLNPSPVAAMYDRAYNGKSLETVYDNIEGGPKVRGIDLLRDPYLNKVIIYVFF
jgi:hypothetical protein